MVNAKITATTQDNSAEMLKQLEELKKLTVYVGIPEERASRDGEQINNAELLYFHSQGSELQHIPARPVLEPSVEKNRDQIANLLGAAMAEMLKGNVQMVKPMLEKTGLYASTKAKDYFVDPDNGWEPNSQRTIERKGSSRPLIDTGSMRNAITYVVGDVND